MTYKGHKTRKGQTKLQLASPLAKCKALFKHTTLAHKSLNNKLVH